MRKLIILLLFLITFQIVSVLPVNAQIIYHDFPPTPDYRYIHTSNGTLQAKTYYGTVNYKSTGIKITNNGNASQIVNFQNLVAQQYINCGVGNYIYLLNSTIPGSFTCASVAAASKNATLDTMHNIGHGGQGFYSGNNTATSFQFRNLTSIRPDLFTLTKNTTDVMIGSSFKINNSTCASGKFVSQIGNHSGITCTTPIASSSGVTEDQVVFPRLTQLDRYTVPTQATNSSMMGNLAGTIAFDTSTNCTTDQGTTCGITIASNNNRILIVAIDYGRTKAAGYSVSAVSYNGSPLTKLATKEGDGSNFGHYIDIWYLINPSTGNHNVSITWGTLPTYSIISDMSFYNVDQSTGVKSVVTIGGAATNPISITVTPVTSGSWVVAAVGSEEGCTVPNNSGIYTNIGDSGGDFGVCAQYKSNPTINAGNTLSWTSISGATAGQAGIGFELLALPNTSKPASNAIDGNLTTYWMSAQQVNPWIYVNLGSKQDISGMAVYWDASNTTETQIKAQLSNDSTTWIDKRTINTNAFTDKAWNFFRWDMDNGTDQYVRLYGNSGANVTLAVYEIKLSDPSTNSLSLRHGHLFINATDSSVPLTK